MRRQIHVALALLVVVSAAGRAQRPPAPGDRDALVQGIDGKRAAYADIAKQIWGFAEVGYQEQRSSALLQAQLKAAGFDVKAGVAEIPTAFAATFGSGKPVIGIVGEFDALPGLVAGRDLCAQAARRRRGRGMAAGTTCSAPASLAAAIAVKEWLASGHAAARSATTARRPKKAARARSTWSAPDSSTTSMPSSPGIPAIATRPARPAPLANITGKFRFRGVAAHAAAAPGQRAVGARRGRGDELHGEHDARARAAGDAHPLHHHARRRRRRTSCPISRRRTTTRGSRTCACSTRSGNASSTPPRAPRSAPGQRWSSMSPGRCTTCCRTTIWRGVMNKNLERIGGFTYTPEEAKFAEEIRKTLTDPPDVAVGSQEKIRPMRTGAVGSASTDLADVSWNVPTVPGDRRDVRAGRARAQLAGDGVRRQRDRRQGHDGRGEVDGADRVDLFTDPTHIQKAKEEFDQQARAGSSCTRRGSPTASRRSIIESDPIGRGDRFTIELGAIHGGRP